MVLVGNHPRSRRRLLFDEVMAPQGSVATRRNQVITRHVMTVGILLLLALLAVMLTLVQNREVCVLLVLLCLADCSLSAR
jgi:hypothetical protein